MKPPKFKAVGFNGHQYEGYYFEMPETTYCFKEDGDPKIKYYLVYYQMTDWGLPNEARLVEIDPDTLEEIR